METSSLQVIRYSVVHVCYKNMYAGSTRQNNFISESFRMSRFLYYYSLSSRHSKLLENPEEMFPRY